MGYSRSNPRPVRNLYQQSVQESYKKLEQEKLLQEHQRLEEIRKQNEFMRKQGLLFEKAIAVASSSAAGAGGGSGNRRNITPSSSNQAVLYYSFDGDANILYYFVFNFGTNTLSDIKQLSLDNSPNDSPVTEGGFFIYANNDENSTKDMYFIDLSGNIIWQDSSDNQSDVDIENFTRYVGAYYLKDANWKLVLFDKDSNIKTFNFGEYRIEGGGYSYNDVWNGGIVVLEEVGTIRKYYIINFEESTATQFYEVDNDLGDYLNVYQYTYSNKILTRKNTVLWEVFNSSGTKISEFDAFSTFTTSAWYDNDFTFLDDEGSFLISGFESDNNNRTVTLYNGTQNIFSSKTIDRGIYPSDGYNIFNQKDYDSTTDYSAEGAALFLFYDNISISNGIAYYDPAILLPIWSTDSELRDFYTFSSDRGINNNMSISFSRSSDHICLLVDNAPEDENYSILRFNREGSVDTIIPTDINKNRTLNDDDKINGKTILQFERSLTASNSMIDTLYATWGWSDLFDVQERFYYSFYEANNRSIGNFVEGQELILKDVVNEQYWAIKFTDWQNGGGGSFAYSRQLILNGTYSGDVIHFTFSGFLQQEADIISPGVLEIRRGYNGPIYNSAKEGESNGRNPMGTLWNSEYVYNLNSSYNYKWWSTNGTNPTSSTAFDAFFSDIENGSGRAYAENINWTESFNKPGYLPSNAFAWEVECFLKVDVAGVYTFNTSSDDGNQLSIDDSVVTSFYGSRGMGEGDTSSPITLAVGLHNFRYRMQQGTGGSGAVVRWQGPSDGTFSVIPSTNLVLGQALSEYDHYVVGTNGQIIGSASTGDDYSNDYEGKTHILEDRTFNKTWISNTTNDQNWTLLDKYYEQYNDINNIITQDGLRKGIFSLRSGFKYRIITEESDSGEFEVPFTGSYLNKIQDEDIFYKGLWVKSQDESYEWLRFYNLNGTLIETIEIEGTFQNFSSESYGDRCVISWEKDGTRRYAFFNGESVTQFDSGITNWSLIVNDFNWWD